jgi:hypothetical protein
MCATSAAPAPLCACARVALAFAPPLPVPALASPRSATSPAACPCAPCHRCRTPHRRCRAGHRYAVLRRSPRPRVALPILPPPVPPPLSSPRRATSCRRSQAAATHRRTPAPPGVLGTARDRSLLLSLSLPSAEPCLPYKTEPSSSFLLFLPLSSSPRPPAPNRRRTFLAGIRRDPSTPSKFPLAYCFPTSSTSPPT